jgi:hypothetical protein
MPDLMQDMVDEPLPAEGRNTCNFCGHTGNDRTYRLASRIGRKAEYLCNLCDEKEWNKDGVESRPSGRFHGSSTRVGRGVDR